MWITTRGLRSLSLHSLVDSRWQMPVSMRPSLSTNRRTAFGQESTGSVVVQGGRVPVYDVNSGAFLGFEQVSQNLYYVHIPLGLHLEQGNFYLNGAVALDRFIMFRSIQSGQLDTQTPTWVENFLFGLHVEGGLLKRVNDYIDFKFGAYLTNTFARELNNGFLNLGANMGLVFLLNSDETSYEEEEYEFE